MYIILGSKKQGRAIVIDTVKARYSRMKKRIVAWSNLMENYRKFRENARRYKMVMVTLTYAPQNEWQANHIRDYMHSLKRKMKKDLKGYAWVAETQARGAVHYHIICFITKGKKVPMPDKSGMWQHGMSNVTAAKSPYYLVTYLGKEYQKNFSRLPRGARVFAVWSDDEEVTKTLRYMFLRSWEKVAVDLDGWSSLKYWREYYKEASGWVMLWSVRDEKDVNFWLEAAQEWSQNSSMVV